MDFQILIHRFLQSGQLYLLQCRIWEDLVPWQQADHTVTKKKKHLITLKLHVLLDKTLKTEKCDTG